MIFNKQDDKSTLPVIKKDPVRDVDNFSKHSAFDDLDRILFGADNRLDAE